MGRVRNAKNCRSSGLSLNVALLHPDWISPILECSLKDSLLRRREGGEFSWGLLNPGNIQRFGITESQFQALLWTVPWLVTLSWVMSSFYLCLWQNEGAPVLIKKDLSDHVEIPSQFRFPAWVSWALMALNVCPPPLLCGKCEFSSTHKECRTKPI